MIFNDFQWYSIALTMEHKTWEAKQTDFQTCYLNEQHSAGRMGTKLTCILMKFKIDVRILPLGQKDVNRKKKNLVKIFRWPDGRVTDEQ